MGALTVKLTLCLHYEIYHTLFMVCISMKKVVLFFELPLECYTEFVVPLID
jgi:hypothetical protein